MTKTSTLLAALSATAALAGGARALAPVSASALQIDCAETYECVAGGAGGDDSQGGSWEDGTAWEGGHDTPPNGNGVGADNGWGQPTNAPSEPDGSTTAAPVKPDDDQRSDDWPRPGHPKIDDWPPPVLLPTRLDYDDDRYGKWLWGDSWQRRVCFVITADQKKLYPRAVGTEKDLDGLDLILGTGNDELEALNQQWKMHDCARFGSSRVRAR